MDKDALLHKLLFEGSQECVSKQEQALVLMGVNAVLARETEVTQFALNAFENGASYEAIAEVLMAAVVSRGLPAWLSGVKALEHIKSLSTDVTAQVAFGSVHSFEDATNYLAGENGNISSWATLMGELNRDALYHYAGLREQLLHDGQVSRKVKEFVIIGLNLALGYETGLNVHIKAALDAGANEQSIEAVFKLVLTYLGAMHATLI